MFYEQLCDDWSIVSTVFPDKPRIAIIGTGALGCYYGARLVKAGEDVHFLARSSRAALMAKGLKVRTPTERINVRKIQVYGSSAEIGPCDLVIIATKATANDALKNILPPLLGPETIVMTLQNGLGVEEPVAEIVGPGRVIGAICYIGCMRTAPGVVHCSFPGLMTIGKFGKPAGERTHAVAALWRRAGVKCNTIDHLEAQRWHKLVWNVPFNGLAIVAGATTDVLLADEGMRTLARRLMEEVVEAAAKFGHEIPRSFVDLQFERTAKMAAYKPSSLIDFEEGRDLEIEEIWGEPVRRAKAVGAAVPRMEMLYWLIKQRVAARNAKLKARARKR